MKVSVVVPARNAAHLLEGCVAAIRAQSRPADDVLLVIAPSDDGTADIARYLAGGAIHVLDNRAGNRGSALNIALRHTHGDLVAFVDAQSTLAPDYLAAAERALGDSDVVVAGGPMRPRGRGAVGEAMAAALRSPFGVGDSQFHFEGEARDVDSVYLGVYRRSAFDVVGRYNAALLRTEDDDLNARIRRAGLRIRLDPSIRSEYRCRDSIVDIWRQYYGYGFWKVALGVIRPEAIRIRHFVPAVFVASLVVTGSLAILDWWTPVAVLVGAWLVAAFAAAIFAPADSTRARILFPLVALTMHLAYGLGSIIGALSTRRLSPKITAGAAAAEPLNGE